MKERFETRQKREDNHEMEVFLEVFPYLGKNQEINQILHELKIMAADLKIYK